MADDSDEVTHGSQEYTDNVSTGIPRRTPDLEENSGRTQQKTVSEDKPQTYDSSYWQNKLTRAKVEREARLDFGFDVSKLDSQIKLYQEAIENKEPRPPRISDQQVTR